MRKAIIIGAGPAGIATALRLQQQSDISCTIYELRSEPTTLGGAVGIPSNGLRLLSRLGVLDRLFELGSSQSTIVIHSLSGSILGQRDLVGAARDKTGGFGYLRIVRKDLLQTLLEAAETAKIPIHYGKKLTEITETENEVTISFEDGTTGTADILLGCDGIHSAVRRLYIDPLQEPKYTGFCGLGSTVSICKLANSTSEQLKTMNAVFTQRGMFAAMPCTASGDEMLWFFSKEEKIPESGDTRDGWEIKRAGEITKFQGEALDLLDGGQGEWVNTLRDIIRQSSMMRFYPVFQLSTGGNWYKGRCLLLGDAAHAMSPHAGQGTSMALEDAFLISRILEDSNRSIDDVFATFDRIRRPRVEEMAIQATKNAQVRKQSSSMILRVKELFIWGYMQFAGVFQLIWNAERHLVYDVDTVDIASVLN